MNTRKQDIKKAENEIHWIIVDDDENILKGIFDELQDYDINKNMIHCLTPVGQKRLNENDIVPDKLWLDFYDENSDRDFLMRLYDPIKMDFEDGVLSLFTLLRNIQKQVSENQNTLNFVFFLDLLFQENYGFCGFDIFRSIRWHIYPEHYIIRFLSCLSRRVVENFLDNEYKNLKLGNELSIKEKSIKGTRIGANKYNRIDLGFFSKSGYREDVKKDNEIIKIKILNRNSIDIIKNTLPRKISYKDIFWSYNYVYKNSSLIHKERDDNKDVKLTVSLVPYNQHVTREELFNNRWQFLKMYYKYIVSKEKNSKIISEIGTYNNQLVNELYFPISGGGDIKNKLTNGLHFKFNIGDKTKNNKSGMYISLDFNQFPIYREELEKWYRLSGSNENTIDVLFIGEGCKVSLAGHEASYYCINAGEVYDLLTIVGKKRPRYIIVNMCDDSKSTMLLQHIKETTKSIPYFDIHGFGVYFSNDIWASKGINQSCILNKINGEFNIEYPMSPIFWKLTCLLNLENQLDTIQHDFVHRIKYITEKNWEETKLWMANLYNLKGMDNDCKEYKSLATAIATSTFDIINKEWKFGSRTLKMKEMFTFLKLSYIPEREIKWVLISNNTQLACTIKNELRIMSEHVRLSNNLKYNNKNFQQWNFSEIKDKHLLETKLNELQDDNTQYVFMFDNNVPVYLQKKKQMSISYETAVQTIAFKLKNKSKTFRILFNYKSEERSAYFTDRKYLDVKDKNNLVKLDKNMKDVAAARQLFLYYPDDKKNINLNHIEIFTPDVLYFIREDLAKSYSLNNELLNIIESKKIPDGTVKKVTDFYNTKICNSNHDLSGYYNTDVFITLCNWSGYTLNERDNTNFFIDRLILIFKFIQFKTDYNRSDNKDLFNELKKYKLSHEGSKIRWNNLFKHEQDILIKDVFIQDVINKFRKTYNDCYKNKNELIKDALSIFFFFSKSNKKELSGVCHDLAVNL